MRGSTLALVFFFACFAGAQTPTTTQPARQQATQPPDASNENAATLHTRAQLVEVDVVVTDRQGNPVHNLQPSDFSVFEDKKQQTVKNFDEHDSANPSLTTPAPVTNVFSNALLLPEKSPVDVLLLDSLNTPSDSQQYLRDQLVSYIDHAKPETRLAIFVLNTRLHLLQGLTSDPALLKLALLRQGVKFSPLLQRDLNDSDSHEISKTLTDAITSNPTMSGTLIQIQSMLLDTEARRTSEKIQLRIQFTLDALDELARYLAGVPGRKNLVWFSGAFPTTILRDPQTTGDQFAGNASMDDQVRTTLNLLARSRVAVSPVDARGLEAPPSSFSTEPTGSPSTDRLTYGTTAVNPRDAQFYRDTASEHGTMEEIAEATGGMAIYNTTGLSNALSKVTATAHSYYTLSYTPPDTARPGTTREITVKVKQSGLHLAYRRQYVSESVATVSGSQALIPTAGGSSIAVRTAMAPNTPDATEVLFEVTPQLVPASESLPAESAAPAVKWVGKAAFESDPHAKYNLVMNLDAKTISFTQSPDGKMHAVIDLILIVFDARGKQVDSKIDRAVFALDPERYRKFLTDGIRYRFHLILPAAGDQVLRFGVHDAMTDRIGTLELSADALRTSAEKFTP